MISTDVFELSLLSAMLKNEDMMKKIIGMVDSNMFSSSMSVEIFDIVNGYQAEYGKIPSKHDIIHLFKKGKPIEDVKQFSDLLELLLNQDVNQDFVMNELNKYIKLRSLEHLFKKQYDHAKSGMEVDISNIISDMFKIQFDTLKDRKMYGVGLDEVDFLVEQSKRRNYIPTNVSFLNEKLDGGGIANGQLGIILAPPNYGKTMMLLNFALHAYLKRFNVLFVTLEMESYSIMRRCMTLLAGALHEEMTHEKLRQITTKLENQFKILYRPVRSLTVDYLYSVYHQAMADGVKFDVMYIDYADLLTTTVGHKEKRFELSDIFTGLKGMAQILDIPVWSATQTNREGMKAETVTMEHLSEDFSKGMISDIILSLSNKMAPGRVVKLYLTKQREGESNVTISTYVNGNLWCEENEEALNSVNLDGAEEGVAL